MTCFISQNEYFAYFDAIHALTNVSLHGIPNVKLEEESFIPLNRFNVLHVYVVHIKRLAVAILSKKSRRNRQLATDQKIAQLQKHILTISQTNQRLNGLIKKGDMVESLVSPQYYSLRALKLHQEAFSLLLKWNQFIESSTKPKKSFKIRLKRFLGYAINSPKDSLTVTNSSYDTLNAVRGSSLFKMRSLSFAKICQSYRGFSNPKRGLSPINHHRLQVMGGMDTEASKEAATILKKEKIKDEDTKTALLNVDFTVGDPMAVEEYMETIALNTFKGIHSQLELSEGLLHFDTQVGPALVESFKKVQSLDLLFPLFKSAKHHFCHSQSATLQAINVLMGRILKPDVETNFAKISESDLGSWLKEAVELFPEEAAWIKALFFEEIIVTYATKLPTKKANLNAFAMKFLACDRLSADYINRKLS